MASDKGFIEFVSDQMSSAGEITYRKMFGGYAVYCYGKVIALVCDNKLFVKPTIEGKKFIGKSSEAPPYPGAKLYFLIEDKMEDSEWLTKLIKITFNSLPDTKPKKKKEKV
ncbi:MAG: TfoX/Sxy family protein [Bacteroidia bacterium]|nr:TfoX/Sxy family protein [Bacteroidia bacterium]